MFSSRFPHYKSVSIKGSEIFKNSSLNSFMSVSRRNMEEYGDVVMCFMCTASSCNDWHNDTFFFFFLTFLFGRQVQRLRHLKGAKCEEHHHQCPWGPAMLGARLHVVSIITPLSQVMVSHQPWVSSVFILDFIYFSTIFMCDEQIEC